MEQEILDLYNELKKLNIEHSKRYKEIPPNLSYNEYLKYISITQDKIDNVSRKIRLIDKPIFNDEISESDHLMTLSDFIENVKSGGFIDYDGYGYYVRNNRESNIMILPSDVKHNMVRNDFDTIVWYNR